MKPSELLIDVVIDLDEIKDSLVDVSGGLLEPDSYLETLQGYGSELKAIEKQLTHLRPQLQGDSLEYLAMIESNLAEIWLIWNPLAEIPAGAIELEPILRSLALPFVTRRDLLNSYIKGEATPAEVVPVLQATLAQLKQKQVRDNAELSEIATAIQVFDVLYN